MIERRFNHKGIIYAFKCAKLHKVMSKMPSELNSKLHLYFQYILSNEMPEYLFEDPKIQRCSTFRIKKLERGGLNHISDDLINSKVIRVISKNTQNNDLSQSITNLSKYVEEIYHQFAQISPIDPIKPGHDPVLNNILLKDENAIAVETPIWLTRQTKLHDFMKSDEKFCFSFKTSFTGHIDLLLYNPADESLVVVDYKPERQYLRSLPQVAFYALALKRVLDYPKIKCISFSKEDAWLYDPEILRTNIEEKIKDYGNPPLRWRKIMKWF